MLKIYIDGSKRYDKRLELRNEAGVIIDSIEGDIDMVSSLQKLLSKHSLTTKNVLFDYFRGPGDSFTGLKISAVISNVLNWSNGKIKSSETVMPEYGREPNISQRKK